MATNTRFDSHANQKEVEQYYKADQKRAKMFNHVFGDLSTSVRKDGVVKNALRILSRPDEFMKNLNEKFEVAKKKFK